MAVLNIPFGADFEKELIEFITSNFSHTHPNFAKIKIFTPSKETAKNLKFAFAKQNIIMPKVISITEIADNSSIKVCSTFKAKLLLYKIAKKHLPSFSVGAIFNYLDNFLELEKLVSQNETDFVKSLKSSERLIENMAFHLQSSLINFLKIHAEWQNFKAQNGLKMQDDVNFEVLENLKTEDFNQYEAVFLAYFQGSNKIQVNLAKHISSLPNGFVVLNGEEQNTISTKLIKDFAKELKCEVVQVKKYIQNSKHFLQEHSNLLTLTNQLALRITSILHANNKAKIGVVCYNFETGLLISKKFEEMGLETTTVFTQSMEENPLFKLFTLYLQNEDLSNYLALTKSSYTIFEKEAVKNFEKEVRTPNLKAKRPFGFSSIKANNLQEFLGNKTSDFIKILTPEALETDFFSEFSSFLKDLKNEIEDFSLEEEKFYIPILKNFAKSVKKSHKNSQNIFILSPVEARAKQFDAIFLTDLTDKNLPKPPSSNKILNHHLQKLLEIDEKKEGLEWLDFASFLLSAPSVYCINSKKNFEGKEENYPSPFLLYAMECYNFTELDEVFYNTSPINPEFIAPAFKMEYVKKLTPTSFERLLSNPFDFYVSNVLGLKLQNEISEELAKNHLGTLIHEAIHKFYTNGESIVLNCKKWLSEKGYYYDFLLYEEHLKKMQEFFEKKQNNLPKSTIMEEEISTFEDFNGHKINLSAKPDRVEFFDDEIRIIDYKVYSQKISSREVETGKKPQLPFQGYILSKMYPDFKGKISLIYYFINLGSFPDVITEYEIKFEDFNIVRNSIEKLITNLQTLFYKEGSNSFYKHLARKV